VEWANRGRDLREEGQAFAEMAEARLGMNVRTALVTDQPRLAVFVSRQDHCFHDILLRFKAGELPGEVACIISNHEDLRPAADFYGIPFHHVPVTRETKEEAEDAQLAILRETGVELAVLARYMQILSQGFLDAFARPVINIHHSFLPAFAGGRPYHQAHERGVKLIGATAHYATEDLDEGPIIAQEVSHVSHRHSVKDLIRRGRDLEKIVFAQAIRWHLENRILVYNNKTVVFD